MISYNWKAEFSQEELKRIEGCHIKSHSEFSYTFLIEQLVIEATNALDRYEAILNEMEEDKEYWDDIRRNMQRQLDD